MNTLLNSHFSQDFTLNSTIRQISVAAAMQEQDNWDKDQGYQ